jgi:hypothetical protein
MVNLSEKLAPIYRDETEERIKNQIINQRQVYNLLYPL